MLDLSMDPLGPFQTGTFNGAPIGWVAAADRIRAVQRFDRAQCEAALELRGLQATVRRAVERRLKQLSKEVSHHG